MTEILEQLEPIAAILGPNSVKATYSGTQIYNANAAAYRPGWRIDVDGSYHGARVTFTKKGTSLDETAKQAEHQLKEALGLH